MRAYIICIVLATLINMAAEFFLKRNKKKIGISLLIASLIIICMIAGARDITVGTDVRGYVVRLVGVANSHPGIIDYLSHANSDFLFSLVVYAGNLFGDMSAVLFLIELAVAAPIYVYAYKERDNLSLSLIILVFFLNMFCLSLSMMRQSVAISLCVLAYHYFRNNKNKKGLLISIAAILFHKTAIVFVVIALLMRKMVGNKKNRGVAYPLLLLLLVVLSPIVERIISITDYSDYLSNALFVRDFSIGSILKRAMFVVLWAICSNKNNDQKDKNMILYGLMLSSVSLFCTIMSFKVPGMGRMGYYFFDINNFMIIEYLPRRFNMQKLATIGMVVVYVFLWWNMTYIPNDPSGVFPYKSSSIVILNEKGQQ